jgi:hypothetical protein
MFDSTIMLYVTKSSMENAAFIFQALSSVILQGGDSPLIKVV